MGQFCILQNDSHVTKQYNLTDCAVHVLFFKQITFMGGRNIADTSREEDDDDEEISSRRLHSVPKLNWKKLGQKACVLFRRTPSIDFM